jgi:hypothetical protein
MQKRVRRVANFWGVMMIGILAHDAFKIEGNFDGQLTIPRIQMINCSRICILYLINAFAQDKRFVIY